MAQTPNLHDWMEALYREKGGYADSFNCTAVALTMDDLKRLETGILTHTLPETPGFFFGRSTGSETQDDLAFGTNAQKAIAEGYNVYYKAWW